VELPRAAPRIFISYRRQDTRAYAAWLQEILAERYGKSGVFRDAGSIQPGTHFPTEIARAISACSDAFVLIGPSWHLRGASEHPLLQDPDDWVRLEIEAAIQGGLRLVPLLLDDATMPARRDLPPTLGLLAETQAYRVRDASFAADVRGVMDALEKTPRSEMREYMGSAKATREQRFSVLVHLFVSRVEQKGIASRAMPFLRVDAFRKQFDSLIEHLEPDEDVVDLALSTSRDGQKLTYSSILALSAYIGILALSTRRLIYIPRLNPSSVTVVKFADIVDIRKDPFFARIVIILRDRRVQFSLSPKPRNAEFVAYISDRLTRA